jgi:hypothetical protein
MLSTEEEGHLESIVYFLSEALRAAIEAGDRLQQSPCSLPQFTPAMDCAEIADKLASFRQHVNALWSDEMLMLTKVLRARELAKELRIHEPDLKPEIDTFQLATVMAPDLRDLLIPDADTMFNGAAQPKRFLEARGYPLADAEITGEPLLGYRLAGQLDVRLLIGACETLHFGLAARYGFDSLPSHVAIADMAWQELAREGEEPLLLTDLMEIVPEEQPLAPFGWHDISINREPLRH